jgi:hypothetical protein
LIVTMNPAESAIALTLAVMRNTTNRQNQIADKQMGKQDPIDIDRDGILAEMAFGKQFNLYPDFSVHARKGGADLVMHEGLKVDIKATRYKAGRLVIQIDKPVDEVDIYVLGIVDGNDVNFVGYIKSADAIAATNITDLGHGKTYAVDQNHLKKFKQDQG